MNAKLERLLLSGVLLVGLAGIVLISRHFDRKAATVDVSGMVRRTEIGLASETNGRLISVEVVPGQHVRKGDLVALLSNPELEASLGRAQAAAVTARAQRDELYAGVRKERVAIAAEAVRAAKANLLLARQQKDRADTLAAQGFASAARVDQVHASFDKAAAELALKQAQHRAAVDGPTAEERAIADANVTLAEATIAMFQAELDQTRLIAPIDGTVGIQVAELGEVINPGAPVVTIEIDQGNWLSFTLREDALKGLTIGSTARLRAGRDRLVVARVAELRPLGEFATWRAARVVDDHDVNSFHLRLEATGNDMGLQPGMTVWLAADR